MKNLSFIGRKDELAELKRQDELKKSSLIVCLGRRRIGKSRLIQQFAKEFPQFIEIQGLAPSPGQTNQDQLNHFSHELARQTGLPAVGFSDWSEAFQLLAQHNQNRRVLVLIDEISWLGAHDRDFPGKLKISWDQHLSKNKNLRLVVCGSVSAWIQKNIIQSTLFVGRISLAITLKDLSLKESFEFCGSRKNRLSPMEFLRILSLTGGVPRHLEEINFNKSSNANFQNLCFKKSGFLSTEFESIFEDVFGRRSSAYKKIIQALVPGPQTQSQICKASGQHKNRVFSDYLRDLELSGFIRKEMAWDLKSGKDTPHIRRYRLSDAYMRFYFKFIAPNRHRIDKGLMQSFSLESSNEFDIFIGLQFENLMINNIDLILKKMNINPAHVLNYGPFFQKAKSKKGCQIDLMIETRNCLYICEMKARRQVDLKVIDEVEEKIRRLKYPTALSVRPVLIHCGEISKEILQNDFFDKIISFKDLLED